MLKIAVTYSDASLHDAAQDIAQALKLPLVETIDQSFSVYLELTLEHLQLQASGPQAPGPVYVDFVGGSLGHRLRFGGGRRQLLGRAVGVLPKESLCVLDATAGLGRDAYVLASMGCDVTMLEASPIIAALLKDGLMRAESTAHFRSIKLALVQVNSVDYLQQLAASDYPDLIYLDPMFPERKKSAAVKKEMRVLKQVVGTDDNSALLLRLARDIAKKRVVVKRHRHAPSIDNAKPDLVFTGKSSRFDVYLSLG